ncbi:AraC family transcriptional regulator [Paenibacillus silvestris]
MQCSPNYFIKVFKKIEGITPKQFRKQYELR